MSQPTIRVATADDAARLADFAGRTFRETYLPDNRAEDVEAYAVAHFGVARQRAELGDPAMRTLLLVSADGALVGYAQLRRDEAPAGDASAGIELARFYVDRPWHGRGVADLLMDACVADAGRATLRLCVWRGNARAIRFYERRGFRVVGTQRFTMGEDVQDDHLMARTPSDPGLPERDA